MNINENWNWISHKIYQAYSKNWSFYQTSIEHKQKSELGFSQNPPNYQVGFPKFDLFLKPALNIKKIGTGFLTKSPNSIGTEISNPKKNDPWITSIEQKQNLKLGFSTNPQNTQVGIPKSIETSSKGGIGLRTKKKWLTVSRDVTGVDVQRRI